MGIQVLVQTHKINKQQHRVRISLKIYLNARKIINVMVTTAYLVENYVNFILSGRSLELSISVKKMKHCF